MNKTRIIKETIGNVLSKFGFKYAGKDQKIVWIFERIIEGVKEQVFIQQHTAFDEEYKIMLRSSARGNGMKEIGTIDDTYKDKEYWKAETEEHPVTRFRISFACSSRIRQSRSPSSMTKKTHQARALVRAMISAAASA